jgi:hypothetical protein
LYRKAKNIQIYIKTDRLADWLPTDINIGRQAGQQAGRQKDRQTDRQADRQTDIQTDKQTDRKTDFEILPVLHALYYTGGGGALEAP